MSVDKVKTYLQQWDRAKDVLEFPVSSATVQLAAEALHVIPARIAKTLSFKGKEEKGILIVAAGDAKIDNAKFKRCFGLKAKMLTPEEVLAYTGHTVGVYARLPLRTRGLNAIWMYRCKGLQRCIRQPVAATLPLS